MINVMMILDGVIKSLKMKLRKYYTLILVPLISIAFFALIGWKTFLSVSLIAYYLYRVFIDYYKLRSDGIVSRSDVWKFVIPLWSFIYFDELYFKKKQIKSDEHNLL